MRKINVILQTRYMESYDNTQIAPVILLEEYMDLVRRTNENQGLPFWGQQRLWDSDLRKNPNRPDEYQNYAPYRHLSKRIVPTRNYSRAPQLTSGSRDISPFLLKWSGELQFKYIIHIGYEWFLDSPCRDPEAKEPILPVVKNQHARFEKFSKTAAVNCAFAQQSKLAMIYAIVDVSEEENPKEISSSQLFESMQWQRYKLQVGFENDQENLDGLVHAMELKVTNSDNFDTYVAALEQMFDKDLDAASATYHCQLEFQTILSYANYLGEQQIGLLINTQSMAVMGNILRSTNFLRNTVPQSMETFTPLQMTKYIPVHEQLKNDEYTPLGECARVPVVIMAPGHSGQIQNTILSKDKKSALHELKSNLMHVAVLYRDAAPGTYVHETIFPADPMTNIITHNYLNDVGNPDIMPDESWESKSEQIYQLVPRNFNGLNEWRVWAKYKRCIWNYQWKLCRAFAHFNAERIANEIGHVPVTSMIRHEETKRESIPTVQVPVTEYQLNGTLHKWGGKTTTKMAVETARIISGYMDTGVTEAIGLTPSMALGIKLDSEISCLIARNRFQNRDFSVWHYQSGFTSAKYDKDGVLKKARSRIAHKKEHPEDRSLKNAGDYEIGDRPMLNSLKKGIAGNQTQIRQKHEDQGRQKVLEQVKISQDVCESQIMEKNAKWTDTNIAEVAAHYKQITDYDVIDAVVDIQTTDETELNMVPWVVLNDDEFISLLRSVNCPDDLFRMYKRYLSPAYILTIAQLQTVLEQHKLRNASVLVDAYRTMWEGTVMEEVVVAEMQGEETPSRERIEEQLTTIYAIQDLRAEIQIVKLARDIENSKLKI